MISKLKAINLKNVIKVFTLIWGLCLIVVMTITNVGFKEEFDFLAWLGNSLVLLGIMIFGLLMGESVGGDRQREKVDGLYQTNLKSYNVYRAEIDNVVCYFIQFYQWFMPLELKDKKVNYLLANNVEIKKAKAIVENCSYEDFSQIKEHAIKLENGVIIRKLEEYEIEPVEEVLKGEIKLNSSNPSYYLSAFGRANAKSVLEIGKQLDKEIKFNKASGRALKIASSLIVSFAMGILTVKEFMQSGDLQAWLNLVSRITALFTSIFSGWTSSVIDVKLKAEKIANKTNVLKIFKNALDKKLFIPLTDNELAEKEYNEYLKEQEKAVANVVIPEVEEKIIEIEDKTIYK